MTKVLESLRQFNVLADLSETDLEALAKHMTPVAVPRGEYLFREGDTGDALYFLWDGIMVAERGIDPDAGEKKQVAILASHTLLGDMALATDSPRSASVRAEIPSHAYRLSRESFAQVIDESPDVAFKLFRRLYMESSQRLRNTNEELVAIYEVGRLVASASEPRQIAESIVRNLATRLRSSYILVALYSRDTNRLKISYALGDDTKGLEGVEIPLDTGLIAQAFDGKKPLLVEQLLGATDPWESASMVVTPLLVRDESRGVLVLGAPVTKESYDLNQLSLVSAVANISAPLLVDALSNE